MSSAPLCTFSTGHHAPSYLELLWIESPLLLRPHISVNEAKGEHPLAAAAALLLVQCRCGWEGGRRGEALCVCMW